MHVSDDGPGFEPRPRDSRDDLGSGWGLHLVGAVATGWGVEEHGRPTVWFHVARERAAAGRRSADRLLQ